MKIQPVLQCVAGHQRDTGNFVVIYRNSVRTFTDLIPAFIFYFRLNAEASLWDITEGEELLEKKVLKE